MLESGSRCGRLQVVVTSEYVDGKGEVGVGKEAGRVERKSLSLVRLLLRGNKPRLRNDIFSHPSNKLHIQQIAGLLPNHRFPPAVSQKLHPVVLGYRDIIQEMFGFFFFKSQVLLLFLSYLYFNTYFNDSFKKCHLFEK